MEASVRRPELFLNTQSTCFLCLGDLTEEDNSKASKEVCLRILCRYLGINTLSVLRNGLSLDEEIDDSSNQCDFSVRLCSQCAPVVEQVSDLAKQQEMVAMLLDHHVKLLKQILTESSDIQKKDFGRTMNPVEMKLVEQLRNETRRKCDRKARVLETASVPKVHISRLNTSASLKSSPSQSKSSPMPSPEDSIFTDAGFLETHYLKLTDHQLQCRVCNAIFNSRIQRHFASSHPEIFFRSVKIPGISNETFQTYCRELLETKARVGAQETNGLQGNAKICTVCLKSFRDTCDLKEHLVVKHLTELCKSLVQIQNTDVAPTSQHYNTKFSSISRKKLSWSCNHRSTINKGGWCKQRFVSNSALIQHQKETGHNYKLRKLYSCMVTKGGCGRTFFKQYTLAKHQKENCSQRKKLKQGDGRLQFRSLGNIQREIGMGPKGDFWVCKRMDGGCGRTFTNKGRFIKHETKYCSKRQSEVKNDKPWGPNTCDACGGIEFSSMEQFQKHLTQVHGNSQQPDESLDISSSHVAPILDGPFLGKAKPRLDDQTVDSINNGDVQLDKQSGNLIWNSDFDSVSCACGEPYAGRPMIQCDICSVWHHMSCEGIDENEVSQQFYCRNCLQDAYENNSNKKIEPIYIEIE